MTDQQPWADLHSHSHFSFLDGASSVDAMVERAVELGLEALALTDHQGLYGAVRFSAAAERVGLRPILGVEIELLDSAVPDSHHLVVPARRARLHTRSASVPGPEMPAAAVDGLPVWYGSSVPAHLVIANRGARICGGSATGNVARTWCCSPGI